MKRALLSIAIVGASLATSRAHAEPTAQERALAEALFRDAKALVTAGNVKDACPKFAESQRLDPRVGTLLYLATCHQEEGKTASAWIEFNDAASAAHTAAQPDREAIARTRAAALEPKLAHINVRVSNPSDGEEVVVDDAALGRSAWGTAFPVDPGSHTIVARAPGRNAITRTVIAEAASSVVVDLPALESAVEAPHVTPTPEPPRDEAPMSTRRTAGFISLGVGGAGLVVGSIFGLIAISDKNDAAKLGNAGGCVGNLCTQSVLDKESTARTMGWVSTVGFAVGLVGAGVGGYLVLTSPHGDPKKSAWIAPRVGPHDSGLSGGFSF